jgi:hypothetical protein
MKIQIRPFVTSSADARIGMGESAVVLAIAIAIPFVVHLVPAFDGVPWGARLLAMFLAPFVGLHLFGLKVALVPAVLLPVLSYVLVGSPQSGLVDVLTLELVVFTLAAYLLRSYKPRFVLTGPLAYLVAKGVSTTVLWTGFLFSLQVPAADFVTRSVIVGLPGLFLLVGLHLLYNRLSADE